MNKLPKVLLVCVALVAANTGIFVSAHASETTLTGNYFISGELKVGAGSSYTGAQNANAFGINSTASANNSFAIGANSTTSAVLSVAFGYYTGDASTYGNHSVAIGSGSGADGNYSLSAGSSSVTYADYSMALGNAATLAQGALALGTTTEAYNEYSLALGYFSSGGTYTAGYGDYSMALGYCAYSTENNSVAFGSYVTTTSFASLVVGQYNYSRNGQSQTSWASSDDLFVVGNGANSTVASNAFVIQKGGNVSIDPSNGTLGNSTLTVNGTIQINSASGNTTLILDNSGNVTLTIRQADIVMGVFGNGSE